MKRKEIRLGFLYWLQLMAFLLLIARLIDLQLIKGDKNRLLADENRIKKIILPAGRGIIYDRLSQPLVENIPLYRLEEKQDGNSSYQTITREEALAIEAAGGDKAQKLYFDIGRKYLEGEVLAHLLGYVSQVNQQELDINNSLQAGDLIGKGGIEQQYDLFLRGKKGAEIVETDALGKETRTLGKFESQAGGDLRLSIDSELSKVAFLALEGVRGAVIATRPDSGQVLCLVSSPSFNPNKLSLGISLAEYQKLLDEPNQVFFNRAISGAYPPGSTFKIVTAVAGLEDGKINVQTLINDPGLIQIGKYSYRNWYFTQYGKTEGQINIVRAIKRSTDTFFYKLGELVGANRLAEWARNFGLGNKTGIDLPAEVSGLVPDPAWKEEVKKESWFLGDTYHLAIGQANLTTSPLQINQMTGVIASDGWLCQPRILSEKISLDGRVSSGEIKQCQNLPIKKETIQIIKEGMKEACSSGGTAYPLFDLKPPVACKTGTAEFGDFQGRTHAWLTAFAPVDNPEIVVTVLVEAGGEGSQVAAPIAKKVLEAWFGQTKG